MTVRVGQGFDVHAFSPDPDRVLVLGGVVFEGEAGLVGHSDADVVAHACADALLGAAGLGDIGQHFPDTDPQWAGADSIGLLAVFRYNALDIAQQAFDCRFERSKDVGYSDLAWSAFGESGGRFRRRNAL